ncbi:hypothetical protein P43SY_001920 [Pythium insidiosum]|uniref:GCK domain-containing protein n=1 Tax=Pythium insidiosum TaxID=114742 RepID=A0AAD5QEG0_PYTIN|nr:hypothetical protein P43SY_001920 [Pythium insidiosum]
MASSFFHQRLARSLLTRSGGAVAVALASSAASVARLDAQQSQPQQPGVEFVGVFLQKDSAERLRKLYPSKFGDASEDEPLFVVLKYNPTAQEKDAFAPIQGHTAQLRIKAYVEDDVTQAVIVDVTTEAGEPIDYTAVVQQNVDVPHITIASLNGQQGLNGAYTSVLMERLRASGKLQGLLEEEAAARDQDADADAEWSGELTEFDSVLMPLFNPFPVVRATVRRESRAETKASDEAALVGTVCTSSSFDPATGTCSDAPAKPECGFCKFMKAGPCGSEFSAWEACLDRAKRSGLDFIEHCGKETLALRDCVDANPEYYHVLNDPPEDEQDGASSDPAAEAGENQ